MCARARAASCRTAAGVRPTVYASPIVAWQPAIGATRYEIQLSRTSYPWRTAKHTGAAEILLLRYEDMRADDVAVVEQIARWLDLPLSSNDAAIVAQRCTAERMREAERSVDPQVFGAVVHDMTYMGPTSLGRWHSGLTEDQQRRFVAFAKGIRAFGYEDPGLSAHRTGAGPGTN